MNKVLVCLIALAICTSVKESSATMIGLSTEKLTRQADLVVEATVGQMRSYWSADGKRVLSGATLEVIETFKGDASLKLVTVEYEGGEIGKVGMIASDTKCLIEGQLVLVFLKTGPASGPVKIHHLVGLAQGVYVIGDDHVARKDGFTLVKDAETIDNDLDVVILKRKIRNLR